MEHIYPAFERGKIMKKELLWALMKMILATDLFGMQTATEPSASLFPDQNKDLTHAASSY